MTDTLDRKIHTWLSQLTRSDGAVYLVGGAVRDRQLGRIVVDIDLACEKAEQLAKKITDSCDATFVAFTNRPKTPCYRIVRRTSPKGTIDITPLQGDNIADDLSKRDFTFNAMAVKIKPGGELGNIVDPFGGLLDIRNKCIRITGPSVIAEDALRILRAVRFSAELDYSIAPETSASAKSHAHKIVNIAGERIWSELGRILAFPNSTLYMRWLDDWRVLEHLFPEIEAMKKCPQNAQHHLDVWPHSLMVMNICDQLIHHPEHHFSRGLETVKNYFNNDRRIALLKLAALFHDIGKPLARGINPNTGRFTFYGHDKIGADLMSQIAERLKLPKSDRWFLTTLVTEHLHILSLSDPKVRASTRTAFFRKLMDDTISLIIHGMADVCATRGTESNWQNRQTYLKWAKKIIAHFDDSIKPLLSPGNFLLHGRDLLGLGMQPGPSIGKLLGRIRRAQDDGQVLNRDEALELAKKWIIAEKIPINPK